MVTGGHLPILTIIARSSSLKVARYDTDRTERLMLAVQVERIGESGGQMRIVDGGGARVSGLVATPAGRGCAAPSGIVSCTMDARRGPQRLTADVLVEQRDDKPHPAVSSLS